MYGAVPAGAQMSTEVLNFILKGRTRAGQDHPVKPCSQQEHRHVAAKGTHQHERVLVAIFIKNVALASR